MEPRYQTTVSEATTLHDRLWCLKCGGPLLDQVPLPLTDDGLQRFGVSLMMTCVHCMVPDRHLASDAGKIADRLLWWLIMDGLVRVRTTTTKETWVPPENLIIHEQTLKTNTARSYFSEAVRSVDGVWVATHSRLYKTNSSYILGHLKLTSTTCNCDLV